MQNKELNLSQKIQEARESIKNSPIKKAGRNTFSKYSYFTPEQINQLVSDACKKSGLITYFNLERGEFGLTASLTVKDIKTESAEVFIMAMEIPSIKATNVAQQLGGAMTYAKRYLEMSAFDIVENSLDFDTTENTKSASTAPTTKAKMPPAPPVPTSTPKSKQKKTMNEATSKYFESKMGTLPKAKLMNALEEYDTTGGYGALVLNALKLEK